MWPKNENLELTWAQLKDWIKCCFDIFISVLILGFTGSQGNITSQTTHVFFFFLLLLLLLHRSRWTCKVICVCVSWLWDGLTDKLTPWRCISGMHAMSQMSLVIDRTPHCLSERSLLSIYSKERGDGGRGGWHGTECLVSTWSHFGRSMFPSPPEWVMSCCGWRTRESVWHPTQSVQSLHPASSWTPGSSCCSRLTLNDVFVYHGGEVSCQACI